MHREGKVTCGACRVEVHTEEALHVSKGAWGRCVWHRYEYGWSAYPVYQALTWPDIPCGGGSGGLLSCHVVLHGSGASGCHCGHRRACACAYSQSSHGRGL